MNMILTDSTGWNQEFLKQEPVWLRASDLFRKYTGENLIPLCTYLQIVMEAKSDELINIFSEAFPEEKSRVVQILTEIDPANKAKYEKINSANIP